MGSPAGATIFLTAAEASGDTHAANLIRALARRLPTARFVGVGGPCMRQAGCELLEDLTAQATMALDSLGKIPFYRRVIARVSEAMRVRQADVLVPVDSPGMNWHMAAAARERGVPVMYYIAPQVWAWAPWRIGKLRRLTDHVACLLPFEQEYLRRRGVPATFVGHPMFDHLPGRQGSYRGAPRDGAWRILLLPGSRPREISRHAPGMASAARLIRRRLPRAEFELAALDERSRDLSAGLVGNDIPIVVGQTARRMGEAHFALAVSGTVTLEAAYLGLPMVICYRASRLVFAVFRRLLARTRYFALANILAGRQVVPELIPWHGSPTALADAALEQLAHPTALMETSRTLTALTEPLKEPLGKPACEAVAELVILTMRR